MAYVNKNIIIWDGNDPFSDVDHLVTEGNNNVLSITVNQWAVGQINTTGVVNRPDVSDTDFIRFKVKATGSVPQSIGMLFLDLSNESETIALDSELTGGIAELFDGNWHEMTIPLSDWTNANFDFTLINNVRFAVADTGTTYTVFIDDLEGRANMHDEWPVRAER
jgi:hypothetical protein